ncbi:hypothetical protein ACFY0B_44085 [Streptomyces sp. NPDC001797]|uniref:hypothetical protein n=1 Tax=Streptomyces sp. NPDC001797 TaxID=3364610 RepID=UPI0036BE8E3B
MSTNEPTRPLQQATRPAQTRHGPGTSRPSNETRRINLSIPIPRITGLTALSSSTLLLETARGDIPPAYTWPCITLTALGAAYDLIRRALDHHQRT